MKIFDSFLRDSEKKKSPVSVTMGMHVPAVNTRPIYFVIRSIIALCGIFGSFFSFMTACENKGGISFDSSDKQIITAVMLSSWLVFSVAFGFSEARPSLSKIFTRAGAVILLLITLFSAEKLAVQGAILVNDFAAALYPSLKEYPIFEITGEYAEQQGYTDFLCLMIALISMLACCTVKRANIFIFAAAVIPPAELCLYFGMVPNHACFVLLASSLCGELAAEITGAGLFSDPGAGKVFTKTAAQSALAATVIMLLSFLGASVFMTATDFARPEKVDAIRNRVIEYMKTFTWEKFTNDISAAIVPDFSKQVTHDGKLGTTGDVEFTGEKMIEVTLPSDVSNLYLKGFNGVDYTGTRWNEGEHPPPLETKITSPEFFGGRALKCIPEYADLRARFVVVRSSGMAENMRYFPVNGAGLLETDGVKRRYGVYFPSDPDWRSRVINAAGTVILPEDMARDEKKMRAYAYTYCLDVPETFTTYEEFFADFEGGDMNDCLNYIRNKLGREYSYTLQAGRKPFGMDFAQWFLTENHKGSCTHFASSAVLLCRSMGIPARYCEGFVIKREDIEAFAVPGEEYVTISVPDSRSHAWAEVYVNGYGWLSFEVTPGYGNVAVNILPGENDWENAVTSEITAVTTEPPAFTEKLFVTTTVQTEYTSDTEYTEYAAEEVTEDSGGSSVTAVSDGSGEMIMSENTEVTFTETFTFSTSPTELGEENNSAENIFSEEDIYTGGGAEENAAENSAEENETVTTSVMNEDTEVSGNTEDTQSTQGSDEISRTKKQLSPFAKLIITVAALILFKVGIYFAIRMWIKRGRRKGLDKAPDRAAVRIYRMTAAVGKMCGSGETPPEELSQTFGRVFGTDRQGTDVIVSSALKARFGQGITAEEAKKAAECYDEFMKTAMEKMGAFKRGVVYAVIFNRYT